MEFRQLRSFIALAECENFTMAASKLNVSQPTVSTHLKILEDELQTQLVIRDTRRVKLTDRGREFYDFAKRVVGLEDQLKAKWLENNDTITLGASTIPSTYLLPVIIPQYLEKYPETQFIINQGDSSDVIENLRSGIYDLGMVGMRIDDDDLAFTPFAHDHMVLITPNERRFALLNTHAPLTAEQLANLLRTEHVISREAGSGSGGAANHVLETLGVSEDELTITAVVSNQETINNMVANDVGVAIVSNLAAEDARKSKDLLIFEFPEDTTRTFYLAFRNNAHLSDQISSFGKYLAEEFNKY